jgi:multiple sugar transport system permease protein
MKPLRTLPIYLALIAVSILFLFPFYWVVISSLKSVAGMDLEPPSMLPAEQLTVDLKAATSQRVFAADGNEWLRLAQSPNLLDTNQTGRDEHEEHPSPKPLSTVSKIPPQGNERSESVREVGEVRTGSEGQNRSSQRSQFNGAYYLQLKDGKATKLVQWFTDDKVKPSTWPKPEIDLKAVPVNSIRNENLAVVAKVVRQTDSGFSELLFTATAQSGPLGNVSVLKDVPHQDIRFFSAHWDNFSKALKGPEASIGTKSSGFLLFMRNSLFISVMAVLGQILSSSFVAFGFARVNFKGRNTLFVILLATLMVPAQVTLIPLFSIYKSIGWIDSFLPLILPQFTAGAFNVFLIRQFMLGLPKELDESAEIDGANAFHIYRTIILPNCGPVLIIVGLFTFVASWQDVLGPLIYLDNPNYRTVSLGLEYFRSPYVDNRPLLMAGALLSMIPVACLFLIAQRYIMSGIATTGLK